MRIAFIIVTYQGDQYVRALFETLSEHTNLDDTRVIVVDNASTDGTLNLVRSLTAAWDNVEVLPQSENTGFAEGNNIGLRRARDLGAEFSLLLNQDLELLPEWLPPLERVMAERPEVAAAQPLIRLDGEPERINSAGNELHFCGFGYCGSYNHLSETLNFPPEPWSVAFASGAALMLRMSALSRSGFFDERLFLYHEDTELQVRLRQLAYDCVAVPNSKVIHKYTATFSPKKYALLDRNRWILLLKTWPTKRLVVIAPALFGVELAVLLFSARGGWLGQKLKTYPQLLSMLTSLRADRKRIQGRRRPDATDASHLTGNLSFDGFNHPIVTRIANPVLSLYWKLARKHLRVP